MDQSASTRPHTTEGLRAERWLTSPAGLAELAELAPRLPLNISQQLKLRDRVGLSAATLLLDIAGRAVVATGKLLPAGTWNDVPLTTDRSLRQSSDHRIAVYKASCIPTQARVADICCGIGGDAIALSQRGPLVALDADARICRFARANLSRWGGLQFAVLQQQAEWWQPNANDWLHVDPDRSPNNSRTTNAEFFLPGVDTLQRLIHASAGAAIKVAPATDLPNSWSSPTQREWISSGSECRQQVIWYGTQTGHWRRATRVHNDGRVTSFTIEADRQPSIRCELSNAPRGWLFDFDPAIRASGLSEAFADTLGLAAMGSPAGFFTASEPIGKNARSFDGLHQAFMAEWHGTFDQKRLKKLIAQQDITTLEIKIRGLPVNPDELRRRLLPGKRSAHPPTPGNERTLLVGRGGDGNAYAVLATRA